MKNRILASVAAFAVAFLLIAECTPTAKAIVPVGLVQSALASYVSSTGYKLYNDNGTGADLMSALSDLYDTWLDSPAGSAAQIFTQTHIAAIEGVYLDQRGNMIIKKTVADVFQQFCDWIQQEYNVVAGSNQQTTVISGESSWIGQDGVRAIQVTTSMSGGPTTAPYYTVNKLGFGIDSSTAGWYWKLASKQQDGVYYITQHDGELYVLNGNQSGTPLSIRLLTFNSNDVNTGFITSKNSVLGEWVSISHNSAYYNIASIVPVSDVVPSTQTVTEQTAKGLAVTIGSAVLDIAEGANEDDVVVIGVGAGEGATASDIDRIVTDGIKARDLETDVAITAADVIDTPAQPYPDVDSLGLPSLGAALTSRFPFCIPWDFVDVVQLLNAEPAAPNIRIDLFPAAFKAKVGVVRDTSFAFDLSQPQYAKIGVFCRWGALISFCFGLAMLTKRMIWTA